MKQIFPFLLLCLLATNCSTSKVQKEDQVVHSNNDTLYFVKEVSGISKNLVFVEPNPNSKNYDSLKQYKIDPQKYSTDLSFQTNKYKIESFKSISLDQSLREWLPIYSKDSTFYVYKPNLNHAIRRRVITDSTVISFHDDGKYAQIIHSFKIENEKSYSFELCHNHDTPFEGGFAKANLKILNPELGIALWTEWRSKDNPFFNYLVRRDMIQKFGLVVHSTEGMRAMTYSFDNSLLKSLGVEN